MPHYSFFTTYSGVKLPLKLVGPIQEAEVEHRNTYIRAEFDDQDRMIGVEKLVYGEVELTHRYDYDSDGALKTARITMDGETTVMNFGAAGR